MLLYIILLNYLVQILVTYRSWLSVDVVLEHQKAEEGEEEDGP